MSERGTSIARTLAGWLAAGARVALPIVAAIVALAVAANAGLTVARLFARIGADVPAQVLAAGASVGVLIALIGVLALGDNANIRALAILYAIAWLPLVLVLVALEAALSSAIVAVPLSLSESGRTVAALLAGLALLPLATIAIASRRTDPGDVRQALGYYVGNALKVVLLVATSAANLAFGLTRGVPLEVSLFVAVVLETGFILALTRANGHILHALALVVFGAAISTVAVETVGTLSGLAALSELARIGEILYLTTPALAIAYIVFTALDERVRDAIIEAEARPLGRRIADAIRGARMGIAEIGEAIRGAPSLPAPGASTGTGGELYADTPPDDVPVLAQTDIDDVPVPPEDTGTPPDFQPAPASMRRGRRRNAENE